MTGLVALLCSKRGWCSACRVIQRNLNTTCRVEAGDVPSAPAGPQPRTMRAVNRRLSCQGRAKTEPPGALIAAFPQTSAAESGRDCYRVCACSACQKWEGAGSQLAAAAGVQGRAGMVRAPGPPRSGGAAAAAGAVSSQSGVIGAQFSAPSWRFAPSSVFCSSIAIVIGPTPPGTGVIAAARSAAPLKSTSPTSR
jgi:hypothetical protein